MCDGERRSEVVQARREKELGNLHNTYGLGINLPEPEQKRRPKLPRKKEKAPFEIAKANSPQTLTTKYNTAGHTLRSRWPKLNFPKCT